MAGPGPPLPPTAERVRVAAQGLGLLDAATSAAWEPAGRQDLQRELEPSFQRGRGFWWDYNQMEEPNRHFAGNWPQEDALVGAVGAFR